MNNGHDFLIVLFVIVIIAIQVNIFRLTLKKTKLFKEIFPKAGSFKRIKVFVPSDMIASIEPWEVFKYRDKQTGIVSKKENDASENIAVMNQNNNQYVAVQEEDDQYFEEKDDSTF